MTVRILFSGMVAGAPGQGGAAWAVMQYLAGLHRLGHDVAFVEPVAATGTALDACARYAHDALRPLGLGERWALAAPTGPVGPLASRPPRDVDVLINVAGMLDDDAFCDDIPVRVFLDLDPAFVQLWHAQDGIDMGFDRHTHFVSLADRIGEPDQLIPDCGRRWTATLPPVVLDAWPACPAPPVDAPLTTVANWRSYGPVYVDSVRLGQKAHSFRTIAELPSRAAMPIELAVSIAEGDRDDVSLLDRYGWRRTDPAVATATPDDYRAFVQRSGGELGVAKEGYVVADSGWFSDRSACYLASGRPVFAQRTGFQRRLPLGAGLFAWSDVDELVAAIDEYRRDAKRHCAAARAIAEAMLDSRQVLATLLDHVLT
jgi:hypothetical protein